MRWWRSSGQSRDFGGFRMSVVNRIKATLIKMSRSKCGRPVRLGLILGFVAAAYLIAVLLLLQRHQRSGDAVGRTSQVFLFNRDSPRDWAAWTIVWPWAHIVEQPI